jgi:hypothetical protein
MSPGSIRPAMPVPETVVRSSPASAARRRLAGEAMMRLCVPVPFAFAPEPADCAAAATCCFSDVAGDLCGGAPPDATSVARRCGASGSAGGGAGVFAAGAAPAAADVASVSNTTSSEPTATMSPGCPVIERIRPVTGAGISTAAFSVMTSHITWSSCTRSPGFTCHATTSAETVPSPRSGILNT